MFYDTVFYSFCKCIETIVGVLITFYLLLLTRVIRRVFLFHLWYNCGCSCHSFDDLKFFVVKKDAGNFVMLTFSIFIFCHQQNSIRTLQAIFSLQVCGIPNSDMCSWNACTSSCEVCSCIYLLWPVYCFFFWTKRFRNDKRNCVFVILTRFHLMVASLTV